MQKSKRDWRDDLTERQQVEIAHLRADKTELLEAARWALNLSECPRLG